MIAMILLVAFFGPFYYAGSHECHDSQKRSSHLGFWSIIVFVIVLLSVLLRFLTVCQGIRDRGSTARYGLTRTVVRLLPACHVLLEPLTSSYVPTKFGYVYQFPLRFSTVKHGRCVELSPFVPTV